MFAAPAPGGALSRSRVLTWALQKYHKDVRQQQPGFNIILMFSAIAQLGLWSQGEGSQCTPMEDDTKHTVTEFSLTQWDLVEGAEHLKLPEKL